MLALAMQFSRSRGSGGSYGCLPVPAPDTDETSAGEPDEASLSGSRECSLGAKQRARRLGMACGSRKTEPQSTPERRPVIDLEWPRRAPLTSREAHLGGCSRKEVIQPHLPVRLPCYDFTPIADPTFDGSLPYGLGHRLRVLPTFVV